MLLAFLCSFLLGLILLVFQSASRRLLKLIRTLRTKMSVFVLSYQANGTEPPSSLAYLAFCIFE